MSDLIERLRRLYVQTGMNYVQEAADEIEHLRAEVQRRREHIAVFDERYTQLEAERDELRAALVATMEIVQEDRAGFALANTWPDGSMEAGDDAILRRYDAVIAQADAALGVER